MRIRIKWIKSVNLLVVESMSGTCGYKHWALALTQLDMVGAPRTFTDGGGRLGKLVDPYSGKQAAGGRVTCRV